MKILLLTLFPAPLTSGCNVHYVAPLWKSLAVLGLLTLLILPSDAMAGQGWYLIDPPIRRLPTATEAGELNADAPLSRWMQHGAFDAAQECERERKANETAAWAFLKDSKSQGNTYLDGFQVLHHAAALAALCVATDDPRLR
jgi:hypothetical protein